MNETKEPLVSICCITYNHENYIRDAIEGFLMQKTDFPFEIIIHDDASTDMTANIIKEYEMKHPGLIKPIYQTENQHSKGIKTSTLVFKQSQGKYIAICEGDDYWIDPSKLQKQVDYMEQNPDCTFCFHNAFLMNDTKGILNIPLVPQFNENRRYYSNQSRKYTAGELLLLGFIPTASFLFPKKCIVHLPNWFFHSPAGDIAIRLLTTSYGHAYYINEIMSIYRINVKDSANARWNKEDISKDIARNERFINTLDAFDRWANYKFSSEIDKAKIYYEFRIEISRQNKNIFYNERYKEYFKELSVREKTLYYITLRYPKIMPVLRKTIPLKIKRILINLLF